MNFLVIEHHDGCLFEKMHFFFSGFKSKVRAFGIDFIVGAKFSIDKNGESMLTKVHNNRGVVFLDSKDLAVSH